MLIGVIILAISIFASSVIPLVISEIVFRDSLVEKTKSPDTPTDTLIELGKHSKLEVRLAVAGNPNTPEEVLRKLYEEKNENNIYILYLTKNPSLPDDLIIKIYGEVLLREPTDYYIISNIAENPNTPEYILYELAGSPHGELTNYIDNLLDNPSLPEGLREELKTIRAKLQEEF